MPNPERAQGVRRIEIRKLGKKGGQLPGARHAVSRS
jgi:hypothetical protein